MNIWATSKLSLPWDASSASFYTNDSTNNNDSTGTTNTINRNPPKPEPHAPINRYHIPAPTLPLLNVINTLQSWLLPTRNPTPIPAPNINDMPNIIDIIMVITPPSPDTQDHHYQLTLHSPVTNNQWGDPMTTPKPMNVFCVISQNVNMLSTQQNYLQWRAALQAITNCDADAISFQETNVAWDKIHKQKIQQILQKSMGYTLGATTSSSKINTQSYQQGGTPQALVRPWVPHAVNSRKDTLDLEWLYIELWGR